MKQPLLILMIGPSGDGKSSWLQIHGRDFGASTFYRNNQAAPSVIIPAK